MESVGTCIQLLSVGRLRTFFNNFGAKSDRGGILQEGVADHPAKGVAGRPTFPQLLGTVSWVFQHPVSGGKATRGATSRHMQRGPGSGVGPEGEWVLGG